VNLVGNHEQRRSFVCSVFDLIWLLEVCSVLLVEMMLIGVGVLRLSFKRAATKTG